MTCMKIFKIHTKSSTLTNSPRAEHSYLGQTRAWSASLALLAFLPQSPLSLPSLPFPSLAPQFLPCFSIFHEAQRKTFENQGEKMADWTDYFTRSRPPSNLEEAKRAIQDFASKHRQLGRNIVLVTVRDF